ncbi:UNVERIFIED_CONTAM: Transcriptional corepressor [Sesamum indicum]
MIVEVLPVYSSILSPLPFILLQRSLASSFDFFFLALMKQKHEHHGNCNMNFISSQSWMTCYFDVKPRLYRMFIILPLVPPLKINSSVMFFCSIVYTLERQSFRILSIQGKIQSDTSEAKDLISVVMEEWDPQKMLDLYIYDYLIRKNLHLTAETFSREAGVHPKSVAIDPPEGFLQEWWSLFWDLYSGKLRKLAQEAQPSSSKATENAGYVPQNVHPVVPMPDVSYMLQNTCPAVLRPPFPHPLQNVSPPTMPSPDMGYMLQDALSAMMVGTELNPNRFGPTLIPDINMKQDQSITNFMAATMREQDHLRPPARDLNSNALDQLAYVLPSPSSSHAQKAVNSKRQLSLIRDDNVGTGLRGSTIGEPTHPSKLIKYNMERADTEDLGKLLDGAHVYLGECFAFVYIIGDARYRICQLFNKFQLYIFWHQHLNSRTYGDAMKRCAAISSKLGV